MPDDETSPAPAANGAGSSPFSARCDRRSLLKLTGAALMASSGVLATQSTGASLGPLIASAPAGVSAAKVIGAPLIFPPPRQIALTGDLFALNSASVILVPLNPSPSDLVLSRALARELSLRFDLHPEIRPVSERPKAAGSILIGSVHNPLIQHYCSREHIEVSEQTPGTEGYALQVNEREVVIAGSDEKGAFYGLQSLRQIIHKGPRGVEIPGMRVRDWPDKPFRGIYAFLPGPDNVAFFKRFVSDFAALYKFNTLMVEMNACMRLDRHPELNAGWVEFTRDTNYSRRNYPPGPLHGRGQNSSHQDCGDGVFIEKDDVSDLAELARQNHIEFVPVIQSLTHSFYLLTKHKELSEVPGDKWPDTYCASNPGSYNLLFEVMEEFLEVTKPAMVHAGHDEWFAPFGLCPCCRSKDPGDVYGQDVRKIHDYLAGKDIRMAIWGDYLLQNVRGKGLQKHTTRQGWSYNAPGAMTPEQVKRLVPKDILVFNWFWSEREKGRENEALLNDFGFRQIYGNMEPDILNYQERSNLSTLLGGAPSSWAASTEFNIGKDLLESILGCSSLLWSKETIGHARLASLTQESSSGVRLRLSGRIPPSETDPVEPLDISSSFSMPPRQLEFAVDLSGMESGTLRSGTKKFSLVNFQGKAAAIAGVEGQQPNPLPRETPEINVNHDATSLIFLHACAKPATNKKAYRLIWDEIDSADLLGWYEVIYEDRLREIIPIRYGVNILEWNWGATEPRSTYCYAADEVVCGQAPAGPITFFAYEWRNPRLGQVIRAIRLRGSQHFRGAVHGYKNAFGPVIASNAVILKAVSFVPARRTGG